MGMTGWRDVRRQEAPKQKKASVALAFLLSPDPEIYPSCSAQLAEGLEVLESERCILVGGASFELATPAV
jgi:hypothetical protein